MNMKRCGRKPSWNNLSSYSCLCTETLVRWLKCQYVKVLSRFIPSSSSSSSSSGMHKSRAPATQFRTVMPNICRNAYGTGLTSPIWRREILRWLLGFWGGKVFAPLIIIITTVRHWGKTRKLREPVERVCLTSDSTSRFDNVKREAHIHTTCTKTPVILWTATLK